MDQTASISVKDLARQLSEENSLRVIDIREGDEYAAGHIPGALNIPILRLEYKPGFVPDDLPVVICGGGEPEDQAKSEEAASTLKELGFQASVLEGGILAWAGAGYVIEIE